jgi:bifunctional DNA-binding transcriptional regulator/antitoxin component of YhaV-PrlF toxin-antitoxin module
MPTSKITDKGQTTVPLEIREKLRWKRRQRLIWEPKKDGSAVVRAVPDVMDLAGSLKSDVRFPGVRDETDAATAAWASESRGTRS